MFSLTRRLSPALIVSFVALFVALGGVSYGIARNVIGSPQIKNNSIRGKDVRNGTLGSKDVKRNGLGGGAVKESSLAEVPNATSAQNASNAASAQSFGGFTPTRIEAFSLATGETRDNLASVGPFTLSASCEPGAMAGEVTGRLLLSTSVDNAMVNSDTPDGDFDSAESPLGFVQIVDGAVPELDHADDLYALAPDGSELWGELYVAVSPFGTSGTCRFGGIVLAG